MNLQAQERDALWFHLAFTVVGALLVLPAWPLPMGQRLWLLVIGYNLALPLVGRWRGHRLWLAAWLFLLPLSILQVLPDWFLSAQLRVLVFPDIGAPMIGSVSSFMALLWVIPLFLVVIAGTAAHKRRGAGAGLTAAGVTALVLFAGSEAVSWRIPVWYAQDVAMLAHIALYVLPAELLLGVATYAGFILTRGRSAGLRLAAAGNVMLVYLGALALSYLLIETI